MKPRRTLGWWVLRILLVLAVFVLAPILFLTILAFLTGGWTIG
jgi:hypothetical protein